MYQVGETRDLLEKPGAKMGTAARAAKDSRGDP
jgi:hypothetical protein